MIAVKVLLLSVGILCLTTAQDIKIPIFGQVIGAVEDTVHSAADVVIEGEQIVSKIGIKSTIEKALDRFKVLMLDKIELLGLPRLEPLDIQHIDIDIKHEIGIFNGSMDNVTIHHLSTFETKDVDVRVRGLVTFDIDLNLFFKKLEIFGDYDIDANVGDLFRVFGTGPFQLGLYDINTFVSLKKLSLSDNNVQFKDIGLKIKLGSMTSNFSNLMGGGEPEKLFNKVIEELAPEAVDVLWPEIEPIISQKMKEAGNKKLSQVTLAELYELFFGDPEKLS